MIKKWKAAPWSIQLIFLYWILPVVILVVAYSYLLVIFLINEESDMLWRILFSMEAEEFKLMPIASSIEWVVTIMSLFGAYYGWRLLQGCRLARRILEIFSWILAVYSIVLIIFPEINYLELHETPSDINDLSMIWIAIGWLFILLEVVVLFLLRSESVKNYANIF